MTAFRGEVHPLADVWPLLDGDELAALAESIAEHGLRDPIVVDQRGRLVDGRNRLAACRLANVSPTYVSWAALDSEEQIAAYIQDRNAERRHLTAGQQAMGRALMLQAAGKRRNGRWERGSVVANTESRTNDESTRTEQDAMRKAGLVLDTAARAGALGPEFADYTLLPAQVMSRELTLDFAYRAAEAFEGRAALAEAQKKAPFLHAVTAIEVDLDSIERHLPLPEVEAPLVRSDLARIDALAKRFTAAAAALRTYRKEN